MSVDRGGFKFLAADGKLIEQAFDKALFALREQIHTDCNFFVKVDQGTLRDTSYTAHPQRMTIQVIWDTPYAKRQYYTGKPSHDVNVNASIMWAQKAADKYRADWGRLLQKGLGEEL